MGYRLHFFAVLFLLFSSEAFALCKIEPGTFTFGRNVSTNATLDSEGCEHRYNADKNTAFTSSSVASNPKNGTLRELSFMVFKYFPKPGFRGPDVYSIKICGTSLGLSGCSTITYNVTVK